MKVKKLKRMCSVKGCSQIETFAITKTSEFGGIIICESCLREALNAIESGGVFVPEEKTKAAVPLFYHPTLEHRSEQPANGEAVGMVEDFGNVEDVEAVDGAEKVQNGLPDAECPNCGKVCGSKAALTKHLKTCGAVNG